MKKHSIHKNISQKFLKRKNNTREKTFPWDQCPKSLHPAGDMKKHRRSHSGEKPFHCDQCTKSFSEDGSLKKH